MKASTRRAIWAAGSGLAVAGALGLLTAGGATATVERGTQAKTIEATLVNGKPKFVGAQTVNRGENLRIENNSDPQQIGPHTFSLVTARALPDTKRARQRCSQLKSKLCRKLFNAHKVGGPPNFEVGERIVERRREGWDLRSGGKRGGDSWFTDEEGESHMREVSVRAGSTLRYFCLVHPAMQGKIEVTQPTPVRSAG